MDSHEILLAVLRVLDHDAWEAACISDWPLALVAKEVDDRLKTAPPDWVFVGTRDSVTVARKK